jgi:hypothetical protein
VAVNAQSVQDQLICLENLARAQLQRQVLPGGHRLGEARPGEHGSKSGTLQAVLVRSLYLSNDHAGVVKLLEAQDKSAALNVDDLRCWRRRTASSRTTPATCA